MNMYLDKKDLDSLDLRYRANLIQTLWGIRPACLIATKSTHNQSNVAVFNGIMHLGANPPLVGIHFRPIEPSTNRHTYHNFKETGFATINQIHEEFYSQAHQTSGNYEGNEFEICGLTEEYSTQYKVPFVKESKVKAVLKYLEEIQISYNNSLMVIAEIVEIHIENEAWIQENGIINLETCNTVGIAGLHSYYSIKKINDLAYVARKDIQVQK